MYKRKRKFRVYKMDLPLINLKPVYIHPYKIGKIFDRRKLKRFSVLGNKKLVALSNSNSSGLISAVRNIKVTKSKYKKARLLSMWQHQALNFKLRKND